MVIIPDKFTFVATPRTGSRAITEALLRKYPNAISEYPKNHHATPEEVPRDLPIYTVIRNPVMQLLSWWKHVDLRSGTPRTPFRFAREYENIIFLPRHGKYRLNIYGEIADKFITYDPDMSAVRRELDIEPDVVGKREYQYTEVQERGVSEVVRREFKNDMKLWRDVVCQKR